MNEKRKLQIFISELVHSIKQEKVLVCLNKKKLIDFCKPKRYEIHEIYADEGISAKNDKRPAYQEMMQDVKDKKINDYLYTKNYEYDDRDFDIKKTSCSS